MSDDSDMAAEDAAPPKKRRKPLLLGLVLAAALGGGGFLAAYSGLLAGLSGGDDGDGGAHASAAAEEVGAFVPIDPILVSLSRDEGPRHLRFRAEIETSPSHKAAVAAVMPRIVDALNSYLRAVSTDDLERPTALVRLRAQMLRRIQLVAGDLEIRDFLVTEFVLN
ncbi:MAG: flagellar basal body-associated protein FliL [Tropicimonas sp.]|uniref:flagellar basal body-associated FliL family protein n=1 Tax=Tropicimonas sp. TaxID=2067044 RepID=UPI003A87977D